MNHQMKILWICNYIPSQIQRQEKLSVSPYGGWVSSLLTALAECTQLNLVVMFPQAGTNISGKWENISYCSFDISNEENSSHVIKTAISEVAPDVIHVFGTETDMTFMVSQVVQSAGWTAKTIVNIQGLMHVIAPKMFLGLPSYVYNCFNFSDYLHGTSLKKQKKTIENCGETEKKTIQNFSNFFGRTAWDRACVYNINPQAKYYHCPEILRDCFYTGKWELSQCEKHTILIVAEHPIKGLHFLLDAMPIILSKFPDTQVKVIGANVPQQAGIKRFVQSSYKRYIITKIETLKLQLAIQFVGQLSAEEMKAMYLRTNVFVSASIIENESNTLSEAKILGVPCVASYVGGMLNRIEHEVDGFQYPCAEPEILAYYICRIFEDDTLAKQLSVNACEKAHEVCNPEKNKEIVLNAYYELAEYSANERTL